MSAGDETAYADYVAFFDSITVDPDSGKAKVSPAIDMSNGQLVWNLIMRSGMAGLHPAIAKVCELYGLPMPTQISDREAALFAIDGDMLLEQMQRSMASGF